MFFVLAFIALLLGIFLRWPHKNRRMVEMVKNIPGPPPLPIVGNALKLNGRLQDLVKVIKDLMMEYGDVFRLWLGPELNIVVSNPADVKVLLTSNKANVKGPQYKYMEDVIGRGILSGSGTPQRKHRKIAAPNYGKRAVESYNDIFNNEIDLLLRKYYEEMPTQQEIDIDIYKNIVETTSFIVCRTLMGLSRKEMLEIPHLISLINKTPSMYDIIFSRMTKWYLQIDPLFWLTKFHRNLQEHIKEIREFSTAILKRRMEKLSCIEGSNKDLMNSEEDSVNSTQLSVIDRFILSQELDPTELLDETFTVFTTSQEASAKIASTVLLMMAYHPKCQEKLYTEIVSVIGKKDRAVTEEDIKQMPYLDMVLKEVIRLFPIAGMMQRTVTEDIAISAGTIPAGASLVIPTYHMHRDPRHWHNPDAFDPERFSPENMQTRHPYIYIPFSLGSMDCLGRHFAVKVVKMIAIRFLLNFEVKTFKKYEDLQTMISISTTTVDGYPVIMTRREQ